jgi:hypothetical protein
VPAQPTPPPERAHGAIPPPRARVPTRAMNVAELWRYPVKSLRGERLQIADVPYFFLAGFFFGGSFGTPNPLSTSNLRPALLVSRLMKAAASAWFGVFLTIAIW